MKLQRITLAVAAISALVVSGAVPAAAQQDNPARGAAKQSQAREALLRSQPATTDGGAPRGNAGDTTMAAIEAERGQMRSFPGTHVSGAALLAARAAVAAMPRAGGHWKEQTISSYQAEPAGYTDPNWSNLGAGFDLVGGRVTALAADGGTLYAGAADGGVWRSTDGATWLPISDDQPSLSIGALAVNPADHSLWVGTGEANTNADSYLGTGVYRVGADGTFARVGGDLLVDRQVYKLLFDGAGGVYAATNRGLFKTGADGAGAWTTVLMPDATDSFPPYTNHITGIVAGNGGRHVVAVAGWRNGSVFNGIYESNDAGATFIRVTPTGALDGTDIGRTTLEYTSNGRLLALMESPALLVGGGPTVLKGLFRSDSGNAAGPWTKVADSTSLQATGSAITAANSPGYQVGVQAWYNQSLAVNPADANQFYVGLEEVFQTNDGGATFKTVSPYWDYGLACGNSCPKTTHPDQHAGLVWQGRIVIGNDGGVYSRSLGLNGYGNWSDLNATLHNLQYYDARAGHVGDQTAYWGGLQDNGTSLLPGNRKPMVEPAGGDGFSVIVDPADANRMVGEYTNLVTYSSTDGGHSFTNNSPSCVGQSIFLPATRPDCDHNARFAAPLSQDQLSATNWIAGGRYVWNSSKGWDTRCDLTACDWKAVYDLGRTSAATAVSQAGTTQYAAWVKGSGNPPPSGSIGVGIATNYGGTWHQANMTGLPHRFIAGVTVDTADPAHVFAIFNGYSRRWIDGAGQGVVFESHDGGASWTDISGNLPDAPGDALVISNSQLVLGTDVGVFTASASDPTHWSVLGGNLPNTSVNDLTLGPDGQVVAATHGRGIWTIQLG